MKKIKQNDIIMILILFFVFIIVKVYNISLNNKDNNEAVVSVWVSGEEYKKVPLNKDNQIVVDKDGHKNIISVKNGEVFMEESNCSEKLCIKQGKISLVGETIICLPNKVKVSITGNNDNGIDAYAK